MWWKLGGLLLITVFLIVMVLPIRSHAVSYDSFKEQAPPRPSILDLFGNMYLTPGSAVLILAILGAAGFVAMKVIRGQC
jgi:hypothetical protein